jgi:hypothetical protein
MLTFIAVRRYAKHEYVTKVNGNLKISLRGCVTFQKLKTEKQELHYKPSLAN